MKVIFTSATLSHGGAERVISNLANEFVQHGIDVEILLYYKYKIWYDLDEKIKVICDEDMIKRKSIIHHMLFRRRYFRKSKADIIISFLAPFNMINIVSLLGVRIPLIVADRSDPRQVPANQILRRVRNYLYLAADGVVFQSENNKKYFPKRVQKKSVVIYNPVDVGDYKGKGFLEYEKKKRIISVGRLIESKNPLMLLEAFSMIENVFPGYDLVYLGDGDMKDSIVKKAEELGISHKLWMPGAVHNVYEEVSKSSVFVTTSDFEGMPNSLLEAMCIGTPVISTKVSGAIDVIEQEQNGLLVGCGNSKELSVALKKILGNPQTAIQYGRNAVILNEQISMDKIMQSWMEFIKKFVS